MDSSILIFLLSTIASFIGSLQLGPVNLFVIETSLHKNRVNAIWASFGGILPEFIYCALAVYTGGYFLHNSNILFVFKLIMIGILIIFGFIYLFKEHKSIEIEYNGKTKLTTRAKDFFRGFALAGLNPQLLPFWMTIMLFFNSFKILELKSELDKFAYVLGSGIGAFFLLTFIIFTVDKFRKRILSYLNYKYYYKVLAIVFFCIAIQQLITLL